MVLRVKGTLTAGFCVVAMAAGIGIGSGPAGFTAGLYAARSVFATMVPALPAPRMTTYLIRPPCKK